MDNDARIAVLETEQKNLKESLDAIKSEVHEVNLYLRNELSDKLKSYKEEQAQKKLDRTDKLKIYGAYLASATAVLVTILHVVI